VKLHLSDAAGRSVITGYGEDYVQVNNLRYQSSVIVTPEQVLEWPVEDFSGLTPESLEGIRALAPEILLLGTGPRQRFPHPRLTAALVQSGIGVEVMDLKAACRTYNILAAESRKVAAALLLR